MSCNVCGSTLIDAYFEKDGFELVRCRACGLVFVGNPPPRDELERFYSFASGYHVQLRDSAAATASIERVATRHLRQLLAHVSPARRLLDVGCGDGAFLAAARAVGFEAEGVELNDNMAQVARARRGLTITSGTLEDAEIAPGVDVLTFWDVLEHLPDPASTLRRAWRLLSPGGVLAASTPNLDGLFPRLSGAVGRRLGYWTHPQPPAHLYQFSRQTLAALLGSCGFRVLAVHHDRSPLKYSLAPHGFRRLLHSPWRAAYAVTFALPLVLGPRVGAGDELTVVARKVDSADGAEDG